MYRSLGEVTLKAGERVEAGVVKGPDKDWAPLLVDLLSHKGDPWNWQNARVLERALGIDVFFYVLHRDHVPFANVMTVEREGVGFFGHVWTDPADRRKGASSSLIALQAEDFRRREGRALFLGTDHDSAAYHIYRRFGFEGVEPGSGYMVRYLLDRARFEGDYFARAGASIEPLAWTHWPASTALFLGEFPGVVRCAPLHIFGRVSTEEPLLTALFAADREPHRDATPRTRVLVSEYSGAVVGLAACAGHPLWPDVSLVDVYCHPEWWDHAPALLGALEPLPAGRTVAYADSSCPQKRDVLVAAGYVLHATMADWMPIAQIGEQRVDVYLYGRSAA